MVRPLESAFYVAGVRRMGHRIQSLGLERRINGHDGGRRPCLRRARASGRKCPVKGLLNRERAPNRCGWVSSLTFVLTGAGMRRSGTSAGLNVVVLLTARWSRRP